MNNGNQLSATIKHLEKELEEKKIEITQLRKEKRGMEGKLKKKDEEINELIAKNIFLQNTLPSKLAEMAQGSPKKRRVGEKIEDWDNPEVARALEKLNLSTKEQRELKSKKKSSLLARACLSYCFPTDILEKSVVKGGNQQKSKDDSKLDQDKVDDICEFIQCRFPDADRKTIISIFGLKIRDLKKKAIAGERGSEDDSTSEPTD